MQLCKVQVAPGEVRVGVVEGPGIRLLKPASAGGPRSLSDVLHAADPATVARAALDPTAPPLPMPATPHSPPATRHSPPATPVQLLAPLDAQEVWAAGVTYKRSQQARERESIGAGSFYDKVYSADRPELFFKATPHRVVGSGGRVRIRKDSRWNVPEPELTLVISPTMRLVGFTAGNDMSSRDIEGENPLYLPQAKFYDHCCAIGPVITLVESMPPLAEVTIRLVIERADQPVFDGTTSVAQMKRTPEDLISWLRRDNSFPAGVFLLTGTGIIPPDDFTLAPGDLIHIDIAGIGRLSNEVVQGTSAHP